MQIDSIEHDDVRQFSRIAAEAAVAMWAVKPAQEWTTETVASVLQIGHQNQRAGNYHVNIGNHEIIVTTDATSTEILQIPSSDDQAEILSSQLRNPLESEHFGLLTINGRPCAIAKQYSRFWTFIPDSVSKYNSFKSIQNMMNHITREFGYGNMEFSTVKVKIDSENVSCSSIQNTTSEVANEDKNCKEKPTFSIPLEELRAVQECKKKNRRHRSKKCRAETKLHYESESSSKPVLECSVGENTDVLEERTCMQKCSPPRRLTDFEFAVYDHHLRLQDHSEGEDSGYAEPPVGEIHRKDINQERQLSEEEIQQRLQKEMEMLRQMMEIKLKAEKLRIEQELRQEFQCKQSECRIASIKQTTKKEQKIAVNSQVQLPPHQYEKTKGFADMSGEQYEVKMAALIFLMGFNYTDGFLLATNLKGAGAFDDIIFQYEGKNSSGEKIERICFIQLKHKQKDGVVIPRSELLSLQGGFSLRKLYGSFREVREQFSMNKSHKIFSGDFPTCEFFLYTNAQIDRNPSIESDNEVGGNDFDDKENRIFSFDEATDLDVYSHFQDLSAYKNLLDELCELSENGHEFSNMRIKEKIKRFIEDHPNREITPKLNRLKNKPSKKEFEKLAKEISDVGDLSTHKEFLSKLTIFSNQAGKSDLDKIIEGEIQQACRTSIMEAKAISKELIEELQDWRRNSNDYLTEAAPFWKNILERRINKISEISDTIRQEMQCLGVKFKEGAISGLVNIVKENKIINVVTHENTTQFATLKVTQALDILGEKCILLNLADFMSYRNDVLSVWPSRWCNILVLECKSDFGKEFEVIKNILINDSLFECSCKLIFISKHSFSRELGKNCVEFTETSNMSELNIESQKIVSEKPVLFQGHKVEFGSLIEYQDTVVSKVNSDIMLQLLSSDKDLVLGNDLTQNNSIYIPRKLECKIIISESIFQSCDATNIIAVSELSKEDLSKFLPSNAEVGNFLHHAYYSSWFYQGPENCRIIAFQIENYDPKVGFEELCKRFDKKGVHWLKHKDGNFIWIRSYGDTALVREHINAQKSGAKFENLSEYISEKRFTSCCPKNVNDLNERVVLISAEPGMGKSTLLTHLAVETKLSDPTFWILRINLNDNSKYLFENKALLDGNVAQAIDFLLSSLNTKHSEFPQLEEELLKHSLCKSGKVIVLLDGFDEISPTHTKTTAALIRSLSKTRLTKLWITSRPVMRAYLQNELDVISLKLQPFSGKDQAEFLRRFWKSRTKDIDDKVLNSFVKEFLHIAKKTLKDKNMAGIPLHTTMLAEAYEKSLISFHSSGNITLPEKLDLLELYDTFVEKKFQIYCKEKNKMDTTKAGVNDDMENMREYFLNTHMKAALRVFLSCEELNSLHDGHSTADLDAFIIRIKSAKEKTGMIVQVNEGVPHFVHRTFAEYFVAKWLAKNYALNRNFLTRVLFMESYDVISNIFNHILARGFDLHVAVLNHDVNAVNKMLESGIDINCKDRGGRTAMHLAAAEYNRGSSNTSGPSNIEIIANLLISNGIKCNIADDILGWTALHYSDIVGASWWLIEQLLGTAGSNAKNLQYTKMKLQDEHFRDNALCKVVDEGHVRLTEFMLENGAHVNETLKCIRYKADKYKMIHVAARNGRLDLMSFLIDRGADIQARDRWGATALHRAAQYNQLHIVKYLLERISSAKDWLRERIGIRASPQEDIVNIGDDDGDTPLHYAARGGALDVVSYLIQEKMADVNACNSDGETALDVAERLAVRNGSEAANDVVKFMGSFQSFSK